MYFKSRKAIKIIIILVPLFIFIWFLNKYFVSFGKQTIKYDFKKPSPFISDLYPRTRTSDFEKEDSVHFKKILDDVVYFDLKLPKLYRYAQVKIKFKNPAQPIFNIGAQKDKQIFDSHALENKIIDQSKWNKIQERDLILLQKEKEYETIDKFLEEFPPTAKIITYHYDELLKTVNIDYQKSDKILKISHALRGFHTLYTYIKNETLDFVFSFVKINQSPDTDLFNIKVINNKTDQLVFQDNKLKEKNFHLEIPNLEEGVYKIELDISDDLIIQEIQTKQNKVVFGKKLFLAQSPEYFPNINPEEIPVTFYSTGKNLYITTFHPQGLQTLKINSRNYHIDEIQKKYGLGKKVLQSEGLSMIHSPKSNLLLESDGFFAFSLENFFYPKPPNIVKLNEVTDIEKFDYIIAEYNPKLSEKNGWKEAQTKFDLSKLYLENSKIKFMLSAPGLRDHMREIKIAEIKVTLEKEPITLKNFWPRFKNFVRRVFKR